MMMLRTILMITLRSERDDTYILHTYILHMHLKVCVCVYIYVVMNLVEEFA